MRKIGDTVKIRDMAFFESKRNSNGVISIDGEYVTFGMLAHAGETTKIECVYPVNGYAIAADERTYDWTDGMFEPEESVE